MSLARLVVLLAVVVVVLPTDKEDQKRLYEKVAGATAWTMTFCERNGATCTAAADAWTVFVQKAEFGARLAGEMFRKHVLRPDDRVSPASYRPSEWRGLEQRGPDQRPLDSRGTLTDRDLAPQWRGALARHTG